ncbi:unnamed protein product [Phaedon cochleariae]|uniref:PDZ GRASP-type domain-containing protein n=1 Tax=Phaedon cochleariae TaxID=80249 RepID=A0A9P0DS48_PHACE|nr:unnamed protein product [Phaedon cochleariae]
MGNAESVDIPGGGTDGYHILRVQENSPGAKAGLQPFFDFIVAINGTRLDRDNDTLKTILKTGIGKQLPLTVYSCKTQAVRSLTIEPSDSWGGQGFLGVSIRFCSFEVAKENVWHILEVNPNSPASLAGLRPFSDYIIGSDAILHESDDLYNLIESHDGVSLKLYVYNSDDDSCREITITPNSHWGGEGMVGCGIGYGYLHRIPVRSNLEKQEPTTTIYNTLKQEKSVEPIVTASNVQFTSSVTELTQNTAGLSLNTPSNVIAPATVDSQVFSANLPPPVSIPNFNSVQPSPLFNSIVAPVNPVTPTAQFQTGTQPETNYTTVSTAQIPMYFSQPQSTPVNYHTTQSYAPYNSTQNQPVYSDPSVSTTIAGAQAQNIPHGVPITSSALPPPPLSGFQPNPGQPLIFDPTIAAQSAQQLLSGNVPISS